MAYWAAAAAVVGSLISSRASRKAADKMAEGQRSAQQIQMEVFQQSREDLEPWLVSGASALGKLGETLLGGDMEAFKESPGYKFRLDQGIQSIDRSAAAGGEVGSGQHLAALTEYGQGIASQEYGDYINRLAGMAGTGQTTGSQLGQLGAGAGARAGGYAAGAGQAQAAGIMGKYNAMQQGINQGLWAYGKGSGGQQAAPAAQGTNIAANVVDPGGFFNTASWG